MAVGKHFFDTLFSIFKRFLIGFVGSYLVIILFLIRYLLWCIFSLGLSSILFEKLEERFFSSAKLRFDLFRVMKSVGGFLGRDFENWKKG